MELPFEKTVCRFWQQKLYAPVNREETQEYKLPDSMPDIGRVIASWGQVVLRGKDWRPSHIGLTGGVMVWVLYAPEGGGGLQRIESWLPFQTRIEHQSSGEDGVIRAECVLCSVDARSISSRKLMLRAGIGLLVQTLVPRQADLASPGELPPDIEMLNRTYPMVLTRETGEKTLMVEEDLAMPQGAAEPEKMVYYRFSPRVTEQKVLGNKAVFRGMGDLHMLYLDEREKLCSQDIEVPFAQYMDLDGDYEEGAEISNLLCVTSLELEPGESGGLRLKCGLVSQYIVNAPTVIRALEDAYSPCRELELVSQQVTLPAWLDEQIREIEFAERLADGDVPVDQIFFPDLPALTKQPGGVDVTVGGVFQTVTENPESGYQGKTMKVTRSMTQNGECDTIPCTWLRGGTSCRKDGAGWTMEARMGVKLDSVATKPLDMISGIKAGECGAPDPERPSVIIRARRPDETLWDIAKYCGSTVSAIQRLNKLECEPEENRLLLIPVI